MSIIKASLEILSGKPVCSLDAVIRSLSKDRILSTLNGGRNFESYIEKAPEIDQLPDTGWLLSLTSIVLQFHDSNF